MSSNVEGAKGSIPLAAILLIYLIGIAASALYAYDNIAKLLFWRDEVYKEGEPDFSVLASMLVDGPTGNLNSLIYCGAPFIFGLALVSSINYSSMRKFRPFSGSRPTFSLLAAVAILTGFVVCIVTTYLYMTSDLEASESVGVKHFEMVGAITAGIVVSGVLGGLLRATGKFTPDWVRFLLPLLVIPIVLGLSSLGLISRLADSISFQMNPDYSKQMFENATIGGAVFFAFFYQALTSSSKTTSSKSSTVPSSVGIP